MYMHERIGINNRALAYQYAGTRTPTVVFDAGSATDSEIWNPVWADVVAFTGAFRYDRAGVGQSDPVSHPRTSHDIINELHALLMQAHIPPPYILVGHSFGGLNMQLYAQHFPQEVVGLVLVDSVLSGQSEVLRAILPPETPDEGDELRALRQELMSDAPIPPENIVFKASEAQVHAGTFPDLPVIFISSTISDFPAEIADEADKGMLALTRDFMSHFVQGRHIFAEKSGHYVQSDRPDIVIAAIQQIVATIRRAS
jgi:pimeloyl-ACP methyl ester carboxylesterase